MAVTNTTSAPTFSSQRVDYATTLPHATKLLILGAVLLGLFALAFVVAKMPRLAYGVRARIDWLGTILLIGAVVPLMLGLTLDKSIHAWNSPLILGLFSVAAVGTVLFLWV